jgi:hypothetical protein
MIGHAGRRGIPPLLPPLTAIYCRPKRRRVRSARLGRAERGNQLGAGFRCPGANPGPVPGSADRPCEPVSSPRRPTTDRGPRTARLRTPRCRILRGAADPGARGRPRVVRDAARLPFPARVPPSVALVAVPRLLPAPAGARAATPHGIAAPESPPAAAPPASPPSVAAAAAGRAIVDALTGRTRRLDGAAGVCCGPGPPVCCEPARRTRRARARGSPCALPRRRPALIAAPRGRPRSWPSFDARLPAAARAHRRTQPTNTQLISCASCDS